MEELKHVVKVKGMVAIESSHLFDINGRGYREWKPSIGQPVTVRSEHEGLVVRLIDSTVAYKVGAYSTLMVSSVFEKDGVVTTLRKF